MSNLMYGSSMGMQSMVGLPPMPSNSEEDEDDDTGMLDPEDKKKSKGKGGSSCHQCKSRRNFTALTYCTSTLDKKNKKCRKKFCGHCLKKFYKEATQSIADKGSWKCPSCRKICCCAACRRRKQKDASGGSPPLSASTASKPAPKKKKKNPASSSSSGPAPWQTSNSTTKVYRGEEHSESENGDWDPEFGGFVGSSTVTTDQAKAALVQKIEDKKAALERYPYILARTIKRMAKESIAANKQDAFGKAYMLSQSPPIAEKIAKILADTKLSRASKIDKVAVLIGGKPAEPEKKSSAKSKAGVKAKEAAAYKAASTRQYHQTVPAATSTTSNQNYLQQSRAGMAGMAGMAGIASMAGMASMASMASMAGMASSMTGMAGMNMTSMARPFQNPSSLSPAPTVLQASLHHATPSPSVLLQPHQPSSQTPSAVPRAVTGVPLHAEMKI